MLMRSLLRTLDYCLRKYSLAIRAEPHDFLIDAILTLSLTEQDEYECDPCHRMVYHRILS